MRLSLLYASLKLLNFLQLNQADCSYNLYSGVCVNWPSSWSSKLWLHRISFLLNKAFIIIYYYDYRADLVFLKWIHSPSKKGAKTIPIIKTSCKDTWTVKFPSGAQLVHVWAGNLFVEFPLHSHTQSPISLHISSSTFVNFTGRKTSWSLEVSWDPDQFKNSLFSL